MSDPAPRVMVEFPIEEAEAITGWLLDGAAENAALDRIERALKVEKGSGGLLARSNEQARAA